MISKIQTKLNVGDMIYLLVNQHGEFIIRSAIITDILKYSDFMRTVCVKDHQDDNKDIKDDDEVVRVLFRDNEATFLKEELQSEIGSTVFRTEEEALIAAENMQIDTDII